MEFLLTCMVFLILLAVGFCLLYGLLWLSLSFRKLLSFFFFWFIGSFLGLILGVVFLSGLLETIATALGSQTGIIFFIFSLVIGFAMAGLYATLSGWKELLQRTKNPFAGVTSSQRNYGSVVSESEKPKYQTEKNYAHANPLENERKDSPMEGKGGTSGGAGASDSW